MKKIILLSLMIVSGFLFAQDSLQVIWGMLKYNGDEFSVNDLGSVTFEAFIWNNDENYKSNISTEDDPGNSIELYAGMRGSCVIDFRNFPDWTWRTGDEFFLLIKDYSLKEESYYSSEGIWTIPEHTTGLNILGFEDYLGYGGFPINQWDTYSVISDVYIGCVDNIGEKFDFSEYPYDNVNFKCWVTGREDEVIDQNSSGSSFLNYDSTASAISIKRHDFLTGWDSGDTLNVIIKQWIPSLGFYTGEKKFVFTTTHSFSHYGPFDIKFGLDTLYEEEGMGGGDPVVADTWTDDSIIDKILPKITFLYQNYPNPFNPVTHIRFDLAKTSNIKLSVYNISGQKVAELANGTRQAGVHTFDFDGSRLNSGVYYYTLEADGKSQSMKMLLIK